MSRAGCEEGCVDRARMKCFIRSVALRRLLLMAVGMVAMVCPSCSIGSSQSPEWIHFASGARVDAILDDGEYLWFGGRGTGITQLNKATGEMVSYTTANSGLPLNDVRSLVRDTQGNLWIGMWGYMDLDGNVYGGLAKFDGERWTVYDMANSELPSVNVSVLTIDNQGCLWIGTQSYLYLWSEVGGGLARFDGEDWTVYYWELPSPNICSLALDAQGDLWVGTRPHIDVGAPGGGGLARFDGQDWTLYEHTVLGWWQVDALAIDAQGDLWMGTYSAGLVRFDGENWTRYTSDNSGLPSDSVRALIVDPQGNLWIGTGGGLAKYDGEHWVVHDKDNSGLPDNEIRALAIDGQDNLWIGTGYWDGASWLGGLTVYREGGVVLTDAKEDHGVNLPSTSSLSQNVPNPFNPVTTIAYNLPKPSDVTLTIYTLTGQHVATLVCGYQEAGSYEVTWDASGFASGLYVYRLEAGEFVETRGMVLLR